MINLSVGDKYEYVESFPSGATFGYFVVSDIINAELGIYRLTEIGPSPREYVFEIDDKMNNTDEVIYGKRRWDSCIGKCIIKIKGI